MADEQESVAEVEADAPIEQAAETEQPETLEAGPETVNAESVEQEPTAEDEDTEEFEWNGQKVRGPKGLKDGLLMHADYTKKTQEVASQRKELEQRAEALQQQAQADEQEMQARAAVTIIDEQMKAYQNINWQAWEEQDFVAAQRGWREFQQMKDLRQNAVNEFNQRYQARTARAQQEIAKRQQETAEYAAKNIKGYTPEVEDKMLDLAARKLQIDKGQVKQMLSPAYVDLLHLAWLGEQALSKTVPPKPQPATEPLKVVASKGNPPAKKSLSEMSMDEYAAARKAGRGN
jgi:hypothetical protein